MSERPPTVTLGDRERIAKTHAIAPTRGFEERWVQWLNAVRDCGLKGTNGNARLAFATEPAHEACTLLRSFLYGWPRYFSTAFCAPL